MSDTIESTATSTDIMVLVEHNPVIVLVDAKKKQALFDHIEQEVADFKADVSTTKGREECRSFAAKIVRTKTTVDKSRLALTEEAREKIKSVNAEGAIIEERLKTLAATARAPLTEWEAAEDKRVAECKAALERLRLAAVVPMGITSDSLRARIAEVEAEPMDEDRWLSMLELATPARDTALEALKAALALVEQKERDEAELAALRAEAEANAAREEREREDRERAEQEAQEVQERKARDLREQEEREAEEARQEAAAAEEQERLRTASEQAATAAAETARAEETARAAEQAAEQQRAHDEELAAAQARAAEAERTAQAEREAREAEDREKARQEQAEKEAREQLERDQARRTLVKREAKEALMTTGMSEDHAKAAVLLIIAGEVPRTLIDFAAEPKVRPASPAPGVGQDAGGSPPEKLL